MLLNVTGSSCAGKSTLIWQVASRLDRDDVVVADFDEIGVPDDAGTNWRHVANEQWVRRVLDLQLERRHLLLSSQTPLGELLATPSAVELEGIGNCLVDVADIPMAWHRWANWDGDDPRWTTTVIDTTDRSVDDAAEELLVWVTEELRQLEGGTLPLRKGWYE